MLFTAYVGAFLGSVLMLAAFAHVMHRLLREPPREIGRLAPSRTSPAMEAETTLAAAGRRWIGLVTSDAVHGATPLDGPGGVPRPLEGA